MQDKKKIVIGTLCALIMIMAVGYALLSQQLSINGSASITSNWQVEITNITEKEKSTGATTNNTNYTATTASFNTSLTSPGDYALYEVTVTNKGTLDAVLSAKPTVTTGNNEAIQYELEGIKKGDKILKNNQTDTFTIKVQYNPNTTTQPTTLTSNIEVTLNYEQDLGQVSPYDTYSIGDKITFAGSDWYVIKNSTGDEDYITLMKERVLTHNELGNYALSGNNEEDWDTMAYYWSSTCHGTYAYGLDTYTQTNTSGCSNHNDYVGSKVKELLDGVYLNTLGSSNLKEIDGYKIRLITLEELQNYLGVSKTMTASWYNIEVSDSLKWVYRDFGENQNNVRRYWTMSPYYIGSSDVWYVMTDGRVLGADVSNSYDDIGVRPVINLLKSAIE